MALEILWEGRTLNSDWILISYCTKERTPIFSSVTPGILQQCHRENSPSTNICTRLKLPSTHRHLLTQDLEILCKVNPLAQDPHKGTPGGKPTLLRQKQSISLLERDTVP